MASGQILKIGWYKFFNMYSSGQKNSTSQINKIQPL